MQEQCSKQERWSSVDAIIERWLENRQTLIVQYCALTGVYSMQSDETKAAKRLSTFCELLVDYVSAGHFEVYYELIREAEEFDDGSADLAKELLPKLTDTTQEALDFNDLYSVQDDTFSTNNLNRHLSTLGEVLETRFQLEDELIDVMHTAHKPQAVES